MALGDVLIGQEVKDVASHLPSLWELSLRARDDVKVTHMLSYLHCAVKTNLCAYHLKTTHSRFLLFCIIHSQKC